jgi:F-type H+-transporting ATPase subunit delta
VAALRERQGVLAARAATAVALEAGQVEALRQALRGLTGREVELETAVEPALLGGASVTLGGRTYDGSVRWRLQSLRARLMHGA